MSNSSSNPNNPESQLQQAQNYTIQTLVASLIASLIVFGVQVASFLLIKEALPRIYRPRTYLVPEKERLNPPPGGLWRWMVPVFRTSNSDFIQKCGLDAYFFLRYLRMLLKIFVPISVIILPILIPLNAVGGRNEDYIYQEPYSKNPSVWTKDTTVVGLNQLAWGNVRPTDANRYWVHLILAVLVVFYCLYIFYDELRGYIRLRQAYLTSPQHRIRASATTVLVSAIPKKWCTVDALDGLYDVFPGGVRNIWINRNFDELNEKVDDRNAIALKLEAAQTELIRSVKKKHTETLKKQAKNAGTKQTKEEEAASNKRIDDDAAKMAEAPGNDASDPGNYGFNDDNDSLREKKPPVPVPLVGEGLEAVSAGIGKIRKTVFGGLRAVGGEVNNQLNTTQGFQLPPEEDCASAAIVQDEPPAITQSDGVADGIGPGYHVYDDSDHFTDNGRESPSSNDTRNQGSHSKSAAAVDTNEEHFPQNYTKAEENDNPRVSKYGTRGMDDRVNRKSNVSACPSGSLPAKIKPKPLVGISGVLQSGEKHLITLPSPVPRGHEKNGFPGTKIADEMSKETSSVLHKLKFWSKSEVEEPEVYPDAYNANVGSVEESDPLWKKYLKEEDRETMRLPIFGITWLGWLPFVGEKVDTIDYCRRELARLNLEIETDQKEPEKFPLMNSAFIQFNHQVAAHLACQAVSHHLPSQMVPRVVEISPGDVIWNNLSVQWWGRYIRTGVTIALVIGLILTWTIPVAFTGLMANIKYLSTQYSWLSWLGKIPSQLISPIQGVLPQLLLAILVAVLPMILRLLTRLQGHPTGMIVELTMSDYYFAFSFVQIFLVVTIAAGATNVFSIAGQLGGNPAAIPTQLAETIPRASNYYFSYMILQALSTSAGQLVQVGSLASWFLLSPLLDNTARAKWKRQITLPNVQWGSFFPVYTNIACIGLIYCIISPFVLFFNCITFSLFWFVFRYNTLYVTKFEFDTGGLLFPKAINHLFTGLYVMEICLIGLFFLVSGVNEDGKYNGQKCVPQAIIMIIVLILTIIYQILLNCTFGPLIRYLPITLEDDAVKRDEAFARAQHKRFNLVDEEGEGYDVNDLLEAREQHEREEDDAIEAIELREMQQHQHRHRLDPRVLAHSAGDAIQQVGGALQTLSPAPMTSWAERGRRRSSWMYQSATAHDGNARFNKLAHQHRLDRRVRNDGEEGAAGHAASQRVAIGDALFAGISDEIEDLSPEDRDFLVQRAFQHEALRARRPVIWIPRDDLGVSDDEVRRTRQLSKYLWISNEHTGLDSKARVVYRRSPPDFSEVDLIEL